MRKVFISLLTFIMIITICCSVHASNTKNIIGEFDYMEYESQHMLQHHNAEMQDKFYTYIPLVIGILLTIISLTFCLFVKRDKKIYPTYLKLLIIILLFYIICNIFIKNKYPSDLAIIPLRQYVVIGMITISVILGIKIKLNKLRIIMSSIPAIVMMLFTILGAFLSFIGTQYLLEDIITALSYVFVIELPTQMILCPIYLKCNK